MYPTSTKLDLAIQVPTVVFSNSRPCRKGICFGILIKF